MPAISSATWRVNFHLESLVVQTDYWQDFSIANGRQPVDDFVRELKRLGYANITVSLPLVL